MVYEVLQPLFMEAGTKLLLALVVLLAGIISGKILGLIAKRLLSALRLKENIENLGMEPTFLGIDLIELTRIFVEWYTYLYFTMAALISLQIPSLATFISEIKNLSVLVVEAMIVTYIGLQVSSYVKKSLDLYSKFPLISLVIYYFLIYLVAILSLTVIYPQAAQLLNYLLLVVVASAGLGLALGMGISVGLGTKDLVSQALMSFVTTTKKAKTRETKKKPTKKSARKRK